MKALVAVILIAGAPRRADDNRRHNRPRTRDQVVSKLGQPLSTRSKDAFTYLFYKNGCEKKCGMNDLVVLDSGRVIDAVFRSPARKYSGTSSSPRAVPEAEAKQTKAGVPTRKPASPPTSAPKKPPHVETGQ